MTEPGRREAHKRATRTALLAAARRLFAEKGYDDTTVRDIAEAANVTERTFFRYFASKEDLVHGDVLDLLPTLTSAITAQPAGTGPLRAVRDAVLQLSVPDRGLALLYSGPPLLRQRRPSGTLLRAFESGIAEALHERGVPGGTRFHADVLARAAVSALRSSLIAYYLAGGPAGAPPGRLREFTLAAFDLLIAPDAPVAPDPAADRPDPRHR